MRIDNPSISGSLSFIGGTNSISATSVSLTGSLSGTFEGAFSGDSLTNISGAFNSVSASLASERLKNTTDTLTGDLTVTGKITAQEFHTEFVSASIIYDSGSTQFGNSADDTHVFTGDVGIGTDNPSHKLHVDGDIRQTKIVIRDDSIERYDFAGDTGALNLNYLGYNTTNAFFRDVLVWNGKAGLTAQFDGSTNSFYVPNGNVGVGTGSTTAKLDINQDSTTDGTVALKITKGGNSSGNALEISNGGSSRSIDINHNADGTGTVDDIIRVASNSTRVFTLANSGNVGIGTTSSSHKLDLRGVSAALSSGTDMRFYIDRGSNTNLGSIIFTTGGASVANGWAEIGHTDANGDLYFKANASAASYDTRMVIKGADGKVGIGTNIPSAPLQVVGTGPGGQGIINLKGTSSHLGFTNASGTFKGWTGYYNAGIHGSDTDYNIKTGYAGSSNIRFSVTGDSSEAMIINSSSDVGIGTTSPSSRLAVKGAGGGGTIRIVPNSANAEASVGYYQDTAGTVSTTRWVAGVGGWGNSGKFTIGYGDAGPDLTIDTAGRVGIGTETPSGNMLHIYSDGSQRGLKINATSPSQYAEIQLAADSREFRIGVGGSTATTEYQNSWYIYDANAGGHRFLVDPDGNIGIGVDPASKLHVNGYTAIGAYAAPHYSQSGMAYQVIKATGGSDSQRAMLEVHSGAGGTKGILQAVGGNNTVYVGTLTNSGLIIGNDVVSMAFNTAGNVGVGTTSPRKFFDAYGEWILGGISGGHFENYSWGSQLDISSLTSGGWARANRIVTSDSAGSVFFGVLGGNTTLEYAYWNIGNPASDSTNYNNSTGIILRKNGNVGIGLTAPTAKLNVAGAGTANAPTLALDNSSSSAFIHSLEAFGANLTSGQHNILLVGKEGNTKNSGYIGYTWAGAGSDSNFVTLGHWGADDLLRVYGNGDVRSGTNYKSAGWNWVTTPYHYYAATTSTSMVTVDVNSDFTVNGNSAIPSYAKALYVTYYYHISGYSVGTAGQGDHANDIWGPDYSVTTTSWSFTTSGNYKWGAAVFMHDGDASENGDMGYYGVWYPGAIIPVNSNGNIYGYLGHGHSGGTHYHHMYVWGYAL